MRARTRVYELSTSIVDRVVFDRLAATNLTQKEEEYMAKEINCPCGETVRGETDDELVSATEEHMREKHPEMVGTKSRQDILEMAHDV